MNVDAFLAARAPEVQRLIGILTTRSSATVNGAAAVPLRLRRPVPLRPSSVNATRRGIASPFSLAPELACPPPVTHSACRPCRTIRDELELGPRFAESSRREERRRRLSKTRDERRAALLRRRARRNHFASRVRLRLILRNKRRSRRCARRSHGVRKTGFRFCASPGGGRRWCRAYVPSHRFLAKRFAFRLCDASWTSHHCTVLHADSLEPQSAVVVHVPSARFSSKTHGRVAAAQRRAAAVFDLSFTNSVVALGVAASHAAIGDLVAARCGQLQRCDASRLRRFGDGFVASLAELRATPLAPHGARSAAVVALSHGVRVIAIPMADGAVELYAMLSVRATLTGPAPAPCISHRTSDTDSSSSLGATCGNRSPFCLLFRGPSGALAARAAVASAAASPFVVGDDANRRAVRSCRVMVLAANGDTIVAGLPPRAAGPHSSSSSSDARAAYALQYRFFAKVFRDAVVRHGAVAGGGDDLK